MTERLLRRPEVLSTTGMATSTLYDAMARGAFPRPVKIGLRAVGWPESDVKRWLDDRKAEREADASPLVADAISSGGDKRRSHSRRSYFTGGRE